MTLGRMVVRRRAGQMTGQPGAVRGRHHEIGAAVEESDRHVNGRGIEGPGQVERAVVVEVAVPPVREAVAHAGREELAGAVVVEDGSVSFAEESTQHLDHVVLVHHRDEGARGRDVLLVEGTALLRERELLEVLWTHALRPVEVHVEGNHAGQGYGLSTTRRVECGAGQRVWPATGPAERHVRVASESVEYRARVVDDRGDVSSFETIRGAVTRARRRDDVELPVLDELLEGQHRLGRSRRAVVKDDRVVRRITHRRHFQDAPIRAVDELFAIRHVPPIKMLPSPYALLMTPRRCVRAVRTIHAPASALFNLLADPRPRASFDGSPRYKR